MTDDVRLACLSLAEEAMQCVDLDEDDPAFRQLVESLDREIQATIEDWFQDRFHGSDA